MPFMLRIAGGIDDQIVWGIIEDDLGHLLEDVKGLIEDADQTPDASDR